MPPRWEFLAPWWPVLRIHKLTVASRHRGFREELFGLSVAVHPRQLSDSDAPLEDATTRILHLRDTLELAFLLAIVDRREFNRVVHAHARIDVQSDVASVLETHPEASLHHVDLRFEGIKPDAAAFALFVTPQRLEDRDSAFQEARHRLLTQISPQETDQCEKLKISVGLPASHLVSPLPLMHVIEVADALSKTHPQYPFVAAPLSLNIQPSTLTVETITEMKAWCSRGARLPFDRVWIRADRWPSLQLFGDALSAVFQPSASVDTAPRIGGLDEVTILHTSDREGFVQICSALMHTRLVRSLRFSFHSEPSLIAEERRFRLQWVFYALFSRWATHSIEEVGLEHIQFSDAEFQELDQLLRSECPLSLLYEDDRGTADVCGQQAQVRALEGSTMRLELPYSRQSTGESASIEASHDVWLDLVGKESHSKSDWLVFVPAYGKCRLRHADTAEVRASTEPINGSLGSHGIKSLQLDPPAFHSQNKGGGIFPFLRWFGPQLEALTLSDASFDRDLSLIDLLASCPSLQRLHLPKAYPWTLPQLQEAYESGACTASSLDFRYLRVQEPCPQVTSFYETMADPTQPMAQTVRELLYCNQAINWPMRDPEIALMRGMLVSNSVLEYFERTCRPVFNQTYVAVCREFNDATIAVSPMAPRAKLSFLSVVSSQSASTSKATQLHSVVVTLIFDLAADIVQRRVHVGSYESMYYH